uniref:Uncharacterized protein n=1 Tax=Anguilla anguilla TaxID=7936 RepID=A0A0E9SI87_ANGAN
MTEALARMLHPLQKPCYTGNTVLPPFTRYPSPQ